MLADLDGADVAAGEAGLVGDGADEVAGADTAALTDADVDEAGVRVVRPALATASDPAGRRARRREAREAEVEEREAL